jgi:hypothetical protein
MSGKPVEGKPWICVGTPRHTFEPKSAGIDIVAEVLGGGGGGVVVHKRYVWKVADAMAAADQEGVVTVKGILI